MVIEVPGRSTSPAATFQEAPIVPLREVTRDQAYKDEVVETLEDLLTRAKAGEFRGGLFLLELEGSSNILTTFTAMSNGLQRLGALEILRADWVRAWQDGGD